MREYCGALAAFLFYIIPIKVSGTSVTDEQNSAATTFETPVDSTLNTEVIHTFDELVVEGASVVASDGKYLFTPMKTTVKSSTYAVDLIGRLGIPALTYNPINRTLESIEGNPVILINGRPADMSELQSLAAADVLNVEYSRNVPAIYGSGDFLINVRLKKRDNGGNWLISETNDFIGTGVDAQTALRFHQGISSWLLNGNFGYRNNDKTYDTTSKQYLAPQLPVGITDNSHSPFNYRYVDAALQYSYVPSATFLLMAKYSFTNYNTLRKSYSDYTEVLAGIPDSYTGYSRTHSQSPTHQLNVYLSKELNPSNSIDVNLVGTAIKSDYQSQYDYYRSGGTLQYLNDVRSQRYSLLGGVNYSHLFADNSRLSLCYFLTFSHNSNRYPATAAESRLRELHNQVFLEYQKVFANRLSLYIKTGLSTQHFSIDGRSNNSCNNISNMNLQWVISRAWSMSAKFGYQSFPLSLTQLDDHLVQTSEYLYNNGNPDLKPSHVISGKLQGVFQKNNYMAFAAANYSRHINPIFSSIGYDEGLGAYLSAPGNGRYLEGVLTAIGGSIQNLWNMFTVYGQIYYTHERIEDARGWRNHHNSVGGSFGVSWICGKWQIDYYRNFPFRSMDSYAISQQGEKFDELAVTFRPIQNLSLKLAWDYMFDRRGWTHWSAVESPDYEMRREREIRNDANWIRFTCEYTLNFGSPFNKSVRRRVIDLNDSGKSFNDYGK